MEQVLRTWSASTQDHPNCLLIRLAAEDWTFRADGKMEKRQMSGNEIKISEEERWFKDGMTDEEVDALAIGPQHW